MDETEIETRMGDISECHEALRARIDAIAPGVVLVGVTKGQPIGAVVAACRLGVDPLAENYAQELAHKATQLDALGVDQPSWHFIGQLQTNKVRTVAPLVGVWQSVDRLRVGREIAKRAPGAAVFVQVNLSDDPHKGGCGFDEVDRLVEELTALELRVDGLMGVGTAGDPRASAEGFGRLRSAVDRLSLRHCSMGMSADLEIALEAGSTMVRVGSDLFGPRP